MGDLRPVVSARHHMPPTVHSTLVSDAVTICTFAPRPLEIAPNRQRLPYFYRNIDYDEVRFYHRGQFISRHGLGEASLALHPQRIHHGPHPSAFEAIPTKPSADEVAVLVELTRPLCGTAAAAAIEDPAYHTNWS